MKNVDNQPLKIYYKASFQKRMANYFIDMFVILLFLSLLNVLGITNGIPFPSFTFIVVWIPPYIVIKFIYYFFLEMNGFTFGKLITKTKVVKANNLPTQPIDIFTRSLIRLIPIDAVSFLWGENNGRNNYATGWHDKWTKTKVVDLTREKVIPVE